MKKLICLIILCFTISCGSDSKPERVPASDSIQFYMDTITPGEESAPAPVSFDKDFIAKTTMESDTKNVDTTRKVKKTLTTTKLDTVSVLPEIRKNMEVMKYQQKQLDSLLLERKQLPIRR